MTPFSARRRSSAWLVVVLTFGSVALTAPRAPTTHTISIAKFAFDPVETRVAPGDTIVWENADILPHTTSADSGAWSSGELAPRRRFVFVAQDTGRFPYHCAAHPTMKGVLLVSDGATRPVEGRGRHSSR